MDTEYHEYCSGGFKPDDIVISGISGRFPQCQNVSELLKAVYNKEDIRFFSDDRYPKGAFKNCFSSSGCLSDVDKLDAEFFFLNRNNANEMSPESRMHLEVVYEAIADAGCDPCLVRGQNIGVYTGTISDDSILAALKAAGLEPEDIQYVEAHGTGTLAGDPVELNAMAEVYVKNRNRKEPLYIGTAKSNMGHTEASAGICGIFNSIFAFETGNMMPNRNYSIPNPKCEELVAGKMIVPNELTPLKSPYIPVYSFGLGGTVNALVLKRNLIEPGKQTSLNVPRLVLSCATTEEGVNYMFEKVKEKYDDLREEFFALLNKLSLTPTYYKPIRGYALFRDTQNPIMQVKTVNPNKRQIWFVMTGMGCQWAGMGLQLMSIEVFAKSMRKSADILKRHGIDLFELLRADKNYLKMHRKITPAFVTITSIQIALVDMLTHIGITPDGIVGHSTGEIMCAYADGCCTAEQTILSAYYRGKAVEATTTLPEGGMAAVGLSWERALEICPEGIYPACDNSADSVTISGLKEPLEKFVAQLQSENIFARTVDAYGYGFHCKYVHAVADPLRKDLNKLLVNPKKRSSKWVSSSFPESEWETPESQIADANYFVHNLMSPVRFRDALSKVPADALLVEIAPHGLLQAILKRTVGPEAFCTGLVKRNEEDNVKFLFEALGKLYTEGADPNIERLYPPVKFPAPRGTPFISPLLKWNHSESYTVTKYAKWPGLYPEIIETDRDDAYLMDHCVDGRALFPGVGHIYLAWKALAAQKMTTVDELPIEIRDFKIYKATLLSDKASFRLGCILNCSNYFEIIDGDSLVASGQIFEGSRMTFFEDEPSYEFSENAIPGRELYNELKIRGYEYGPEFQSLIEFSMGGTTGLVQWKGRWIPLLDCLLLFSEMLLGGGTDFGLPTGMLSVKIDPIVFRQFLQDHYPDDETSEQKPEDGTETEKSFPKDSIPVFSNHHTKTIRAPGIELERLNIEPVQRRPVRDNPTIEEYKFMPLVSRYNPGKEVQQNLSTYMGACNKVLGDIGKLIGKNASQVTFHVSQLDEALVEECLSNAEDMEEYRLLNTLIQISKNATDKKELSSLYSGAIGTDVLNTLLLNEESLRIILELAIENTLRKLSVMELSHGFPLVLNYIVENATKASVARFKQMNLVLLKEREVDQELLGKHSIQLISPDDLPIFEAQDKQQDLVISSFTNGTAAELDILVSKLASVVKPSGFIMLFHKEALLPAEKFIFDVCGADIQVQQRAVMEKALQKHNLLTLSKITDPFGGALYLIRVPAAEENDKIVMLEKDSLDWVEILKSELYGEGTERIWLVSDDTPNSGIVGLMNCLKQEPKGERVRSVLISQNGRRSKLPVFNFKETVYKQLRDRNLLNNVWKDGQWGTYRHINIPESKIPKICEHSYINAKKYGDLSSFQWIESPLKYMDSHMQSRVEIYYSALNFKDVMLATGKISALPVKSPIGGISDCILGMEFSGRDTSGKRVCGIVRSGGMATSVAVDGCYVMPVPDDWTLEEAATVPVVYLTCYYAIIKRGGLKRKESILIHSGAGGIGLAAIRIALGMDCEVFTTVGTDDKREYLWKNFPQIKRENIGCSRDTTFEKMVMTRTRGRGVDVVLNSLAEEKFLSSVRCVAPGGRYLEIGKYDLVMDRPLGLKVFLNDIAFHGVFVDVLFDANSEDNNRTMSELVGLINEGIKKGVVKPLDRKIFDKNQVEDAFRYMSTGVHIGKVLLKIRDEEKGQLVLPPKPLPQLAVPMTYFHGKKVYVIVGGLGGFGIETAKWMLSRGAQHIVLTSRFGARTPYHRFCLARWRKDGVDVTVSTLNAGKREEAEQLIREVSKIGPVGGFFNSAVVLKDAFLDSQTPDAFNESFEPKASTTIHLDELSRKLCPELDYFVCYSSISCGRGNAGQTNYGMANSVMERVCEERRKDGLHGLAIQWGIIGQVGVVHRQMGEEARIAGVIAQSVHSCLAMLDGFLQQNAPVVTSFVTATEGNKLGSKEDVLKKIAKLLGADDISELNANRSFGDMGFDSLVGIEIKQLVESYCDVTLSLHDVTQLRIGDVRDMIAKTNEEKTSLMPTTAFTLPPLHGPSTQVLDGEGKGRPTFVLHIGNTDIEELRVLAKTMDCPVHAVFWWQEVTASDLKGAAAHFSNVIRNTVSGNYNLISNGMSTNLALEMTRQSEKSDNAVKSLTLLYGSDDLVSSIEDGKSSDSDVANLCRFVEQLLPGGLPRLEDDLKKLSNLKERMNTVVNMLASSSTQAINRSELSTVISHFLKKRNILESYNPSEKISMDVHLVEDSATVLANDIAKIKEAVGKVVAGKVEVHRLCSARQLKDKENAQRVSEIMSAYI